MRVLYGILVGILWTYLLLWIESKGCVISNQTFVLSSAIVIAGAMAGGDGKK